MKKSKEFIIERERWRYEHVYLRFLAGSNVIELCYRSFVKSFSIKLKPGEKKRIRITIEEIKK